MGKLSDKEAQQRVDALEARLTRLKPIYSEYGRQLFQGNNGNYIIRGTDGYGGVFYIFIANNGSARLVLEDKFHEHAYHIVTSMLVAAKRYALRRAFERWYSQGRR